MRIRIRPSALSDLEEQANYYEAVREGYGALFGDEVDDVFKQISRFPESFQIIEEDVRRGRLNTFQTGIYYRIQNAEILVLAVLDLRRDPEFLRKRLSD